MRRKTRTEQVRTAIVVTTIFWFCIFMVVQPCKAEWISGHERPLPEQVEPVNPYVYLTSPYCSPTPFANRDAVLVISGWENLYYSVVIRKADVRRSKVLRSYYKHRECNDFTIQFTFIPKRGTVVVVDRTASAYPAYFNESNPKMVELRISQFRSRQEQLTNLIKTMDSVSISLIDCTGNIETAWVFDLSGAAAALLEIER